jgi:cytoskeletal protein RodZ
MSDASQGPGWWLASDGKWYPPELAQGYVPPPQAPAPIPPYGQQASQPRNGNQSEIWYRRTWVIVVALIIFFPIGLVLVWVSHWKMPTKLIVTGAFVALVIVSVATQPKNKSTAARATSSTTTTVEVTTTTHPATTITSPPTTTVPRTTTTVAPTTTVPPTTAPPATTSPTVAVAPAVSCSPTSAAGNCYSAGEYCSDADHGMTGTNAEGASITCEDNNGWRWEPS